MVHVTWQSCATCVWQSEVMYLTFSLAHLKKIVSENVSHKKMSPIRKRKILMYGNFFALPSFACACIFICDSTQGRKNILDIAEGYNNRAKKMSKTIGRGIYVTQYRKNTPLQFSHTEKLFLKCDKSIYCGLRNHNCFYLWDAYTRGIAWQLLL